MSGRHRPLLQEPSYRALSGDARALLHALWILVSEAPERGILRGVRIGGRGGLADSVALDARTVALHAPALVASGWLRVEPTLGRHQRDVGTDVSATSAPTSARRRADIDAIADWILPDCPFYQPAWVSSADRTRNWRERQRIKQLQLHLGERDGRQPERSDPPDEGAAVTSPKRHRDSPLIEREKEIHHPPTPSGAEGASLGARSQGYRRRRGPTEAERSRALGRQPPACAHCGHEAWNHSDPDGKPMGYLRGAPCASEGCGCGAYRAPS